MMRSTLSVTGEGHMWQIGIAFALTIILSVALYIIAGVWLDLPSEHAKAIAGIPLLGSAQILEMLERRKVKKDLENRKLNPALTLQGFGIRPVWTVAFSALACFAWFELVNDFEAFYFDVAKFGTFAAIWGYRSGDPLDNIAMVSAVGAGRGKGWCSRPRG